MTQPPTAPPGPPPPAPPAAPPPAAPPVTAPAPEPEPPRRRPALADGLARLRAAARTEPGRLRLIGAATAGLLALFGAVTAWQVDGRADAADTVATSSQPLAADAGSIYRSLADANTTAAAGFLTGADEAPRTRDRYARDIDRAAALLSEAAVRGGGTGRSRRLIEQLNRELPRYTGLVETARANNRQGLPLGGAYLRYADGLMQQRLLPLAEELYTLETERLRQDVRDARSWPWPSLAAGLAALAVLAWAQRRDQRRTNRVFNPGLIAATAAGTALLLWLAGAQTLARSHLHEAGTDAASSLRVLNDAWTEALKARGDESMTLVMRGADGTFEDGYQRHMSTLAGDAAAGEAGLLGRAAALADDERGRRPVAEAAAATREWRARHRESRELESSGDYDGAVRRVIGATGSTGQSFDAVNDALDRAVRHEQRQFDAAAADGRDSLGGLPAGAPALAALAALAALLGVGRRLSEYR